MKLMNLLQNLSMKQFGHLSVYQFFNILILCFVTCKILFVLKLTFISFVFVVERF
jgi:hypothetical protein